MKDNSRRLALDIIQETLEKGGQSHRLLRQCFKDHPGLDSRERGFVTALVHGAVSCALRLDFYLSQVSSRPPEKLKPFVRSLLRMSLYQLFYMDRIPPSAICNEAVKILRSRMGEGLTAYVNGVLRAAARKTDWQAPEGAAALSLPEDLYRYLAALYGREETEKTGRCFLDPPPLWGRVNESLAGIKEVREGLQEEGYEGTQSEVCPGALKLQRTKEDARPLEALSPLRKGTLQLQDISSQLAILAAAPRPGMQVLDLCAAPGGKSLHAADLMQNRGRVLARDISEAKRRLIEENKARSGFSCIETRVADATVFDPEMEGAFDLVIADLPCSGLGIARRKPEIKYRIQRADIEELAALQRKILNNAARYVKPGGKLLYSTCTITREENADNADHIEGELELKPCPLALPLEQMGYPADTSRLQLLPGDFGGDGFFFSVFVRE